MYKIENITSDIKLIHPQTIEKRFFINDDTVKISGIILKKPYKLQITAVSKIDAKKKKRKKVIKYETTLKNAIDDALAKRTIWRQELRVELKSSAITDMDIVKNNIGLLKNDVNDLIKRMQTSSPEEIPNLAIVLAEKTKLLEQANQQVQKLEVEHKQDGAIT